ncbi:MAG: cytochrome c [Candidatus Eremiobacteraeota bacterium]|nr:cytochrome c [Candidatus Eremiobacteraeota bacterium]MBV8434841.1 cytochrome c [Candidatus Eremiobacteraeota bacterium]MBV8721278.1 cytochrome c [Candidatus Eremiobacteraeota bacterium]
MIRGIIVGVVLTLVVFVAGAYFGVERGLMPANADSPPSSLERWAAKTSLHATIDKDAPKTPNPVPLDDANLIAGIKLYGANCIVCHGAADGAPSNVARGLYQHAPQLAKDGVEDDPDGETYWKVAHGIRLTGMPAFGPTLQERQLWELALFLKHMDRLSPAANRVWKSLKNPASLAPARPDQNVPG